MKITKSLSLESIASSNTLLLSLYGCTLLIVGGFIKIPCYPVSFTMHTFVLFYFALSYPEKTNLGSILLYLGLATLGLPLFAGNPQPLWIFGKSAGYLCVFPVSALLTARLTRFGYPILGLIAGHFVLYLCGFAGLIRFLDPETAFIHGLLLFIPTDILKATLAYKLRGK